MGREHTRMGPHYSTFQNGEPIDDSRFIAFKSEKELKMFVAAFPEQVINDKPFMIFGEI